MARRARSRWRSRFPASWEGFDAFREETGAKLAKTSKKKYRLIILRGEELRIELFDGDAWGEIDPEDIAFDLIPTIYGEVKGRGGGEPSSNTLRGRYDALDAYFKYLVKTGRMEKNPLDLIPRPSSKANDQPYLTPDEDEKLHELEKDGHEDAIWTLARGAGLRDGEIADLWDEDVDLKKKRIYVRDGKTRKAIREVPIRPGAAVRLGRYQRWRKKNVRPKKPSNRFVQTSSGKISKGYVWKLVKQMARRAGVGIVIDDETGEPTLTRDGEVVTRITPHALRRTFASALVEAGVDAVYIYPIMGHSSHKVFYDSYCKIIDAKRFEKATTAAGSAPFALADGLDWLERELAETREPALDTEEALARLAVLRAAAEELESVLRSTQSGKNNEKLLAA